VEVSHWYAIQAVCNSKEIAVEMTEFLAMANHRLSQESDVVTEADVFVVRFLGQMLKLAPEILFAFDQSIGVFGELFRLIPKFPNCTPLHREIKSLLELALKEPSIGTRIVLVLTPLCLLQVRMTTRPKWIEEMAREDLVESPWKGNIPNRALRATSFDFLQLILEAIKTRPKVYSFIFDMIPELEDFSESEYAQYQQLCNTVYGGAQIIVK
jgi:hypothetical protein